MSIDIQMVENILLHLKFYMFGGAFSAKNNQIRHPNILCWTFALRTSVVPQGFPLVTDVICAGLFSSIMSIQPIRIYV